MRNPSRSPAVEQLEDRCVPAVWGTPWPDASHLTVSFAPDGTPTSGQGSQLFQHLGALSSSVWQREILRAFQTWAVQAQVNISAAPDGGQPFGTPGLLQGDARFGDIRIGAQYLAANQLAAAQPFDWVGGTWSGDLLFNPRFQFGGDAGAYDLFTVALHEAGHVLGLGHSDDPQSIMREGYQGPRSSLSTGDIAALRALYGTRQPDGYEGGRGNHSLRTATSLLLDDGRTPTSLSTALGDLTTPTDRDVYRFTPDATGALTVRLWTSGISSLVSRVTVFNSAGQVLATAAAHDPMNGDLALPLSGLSSRQSYYVAVESNAADVFGIGSYRLVVQPDAAPVGPHSLDTVKLTTDYADSDAHTNDTLFAATTLQQRSARVDARFDHTYEASLHDARDLDYYQLAAPAAVPGAPLVLTAAVWSLSDGSFDPHVSVYDGSGRPAAARVLTHEAGTFVVQITNAAPHARYYLGVRAGPAALARVGNYFLAVDFGTVPTILQTAVRDSLTELDPTAATRLVVNRDTLFHFVLSADAGLSMSIIDSSGASVFSRLAGAGEPISGNVLLARGDYWIRFTAVNPAAGPVAFDLRYLDLNEDIDPYLIDPSEPTGSSGTTKEDGRYLFLVAVTDAYSSPIWY